MNDINKVLPDIRLRFNIEHPTLEDCYTYGYEAVLTNLTEEDNPYTKGSREHELWLEGWWDSFYGEKPLFQLTQAEMVAKEDAANDAAYPSLLSSRLLTNVLKITGVIAATAVVGYQVIDLVA